MRLAIYTFLLIAAVVVVLGAGYLTRDEPPLATLQHVRSSLEEATHAGALRYSEPTYRAAEQLFRSGWLELARQNGRFYLFRDYRDADSLLELAAEWADKARAQAWDSIRTLQGNVASDLREMKAELDAWRDALNGSLAYYRIKDDWKRASLQIDIAERLVNSEEYEEALQSLSKARQSFIILGDVISEHAEEESRQLSLWRRWVQETLERSRKQRIYAVVVDKTAHKTYLVKDGKLLKEYASELGYNSARQKLFAGDAATPEGKYKVVRARHTGSSFYKALSLDYPNERDRKRFEENKRRGIISHKARIGGNIEIHGEGGKNRDWTEGCVALTNADMDHIMKYVSVGTPVTIVRKSDQWP